eukprot:scaffold1439_cov404-Prasinococcus_capsulatus_cf.AAC.60
MCVQLGHEAQAVLLPLPENEHEKGRNQVEYRPCQELYVEEASNVPIPTVPQPSSTATAFSEAPHTALSPSARTRTKVNAPILEVE